MVILTARNAVRHAEVGAACQRRAWGSEDREGEMAKRCSAVRARDPFTWAGLEEGDSGAPRVSLVAGWRVNV